MPSLELTLLIPTYNEGDLIESTLRQIREALDGELASKTEVIVVDDGTDDLPLTVEKVAASFGFARVATLRNSPALGKGASLARGFAEAKAPIAGFLDCDLSTPPSYIKMAFELLRNDRADIFIGNRKATDSEITRDQFWLKTVLGRALNMTVNRILFSQGDKYRDTQCGFKFFKTALAKRLYQDLVASDGMTDIEVLVRANALACRVHQQPVKWMDVRESKRSLSRILLGDLKSMGGIFWHYRIFGKQRIRKLKSQSGLST